MSLKSRVIEPPYRRPDAVIPAYGDRGTAISSKSVVTSPAGGDLVTRGRGASNLLTIEVR
jgi:hypothetical protein